MNGRSVTTLEPCKHCNTTHPCQWCGDSGYTWEERCYTGTLDDGEFTYWQMKIP